jgi:hypothetical protein
MTKSKRLKFTIFAVIVNFILAIYGINKGVDLTALGTFLALVNTPLYAYILGESFRPSKQ